MATTVDFGPRASYRWMVLIALCLVTCLSGLGHFIYPVIGTFVAEDLGLSATQVGTLGGASFFGQMVFNLFSGFVVDRFGVRLSTTLCAAGVIAAFLLASLAGSFLVLMGLAVLLGSGLSFLNPMTQKAAVAWFPPRELGLVVGVKQSGIPAATALNAAVLPVVCLTFGWRASFLAAAAIAAAILLAMLAIYREPPSSRTVQTAPPRLRDILAPARDPLVLRLAFIGVAYGALTVSLINFFVPMLRDAGVSPVVAGSYLAASQVISIFARPLVGVASDRIAFISRRGMLGVYAVLGGLISASWVVTPHQAVGLGLLVAATIGLGIINSWTGLYYTVAAEIGDVRRVGITVGFAALCNSFGTGIGPVVFGLLADLTGGWLAGLALMAAMCGVSGVALLTLRPGSGANGREGVLR